VSESFTPGPWHWESDAVKGDPYGRIRYQVTALGKTIAFVFYSSYEGAQTNAEFDARLISASPDMLAALQEVLKAPGLQSGLQALCASAVAKATGRSIEDVITGA
jgi:hypothetical protein